MAFGGGSDKITLEVTLDANGAISGFKQLGTSVNQIEAETQKASAAMDTFKGVLASAFVVNGLERFVGLLGDLPDAIKEGSRIGDISDGFDKLTRAAGSTSQALVGQLQDATGGTIDKLTLMQQSVELLNAGLRPDQIIAATNAARSYADTVGVDTKQALDQMSTSLITGNDRILKRIGIQVDLEGAQDRYAESLGVTRQALNEESIVMVNQQAIAEALTGVHGKLGDVSNDAGDNIEVMGSALRDAGNEALQSISSNEALNEVLSTLASVVREIDFGPYISALSTVVSFTANLIGVTAQAVGQLEQMAEIAIGTGADILGVTRNHIDALDGERAAVEGVTAVTGKESEAAKKHREELERQTKARQGAINALKNQERGTRDAEQSQKKLTEDLKKVTQALDKQFGDGAIGRISKKFQYLYTHDIPDLKDSIRDMGKTFVISGGDISDFVGELQDAEKAMSAVSESSVDFNIKTPTAPSSLSDVYGSIGKKMGGYSSDEDIAGAIFSGQDVQAANDAASEAGAIIGNTLAGALGQGLKDGLSTEDIAAAVGTSVGAAIGASLGGPEGAQLGAQLGNTFAPILTDAIIQATDNTTKGTTARKAADRFFADIFDANRLSVIINGEVKKIEDLVFNGTTFGADGTGFAVLQSLPAEAQTAFGAVGSAFEQILGVSEDIMGQLGAVIANNIADGSAQGAESLNNLQLFVEATGKSFEDLGNAILQSMLNGVYGAEEAQKALQALQGIMTKGIPGAIGDINLAFQNFQNAGDKGGRALLDAIGDVGTEAQELGISTFPDLANRLINTFGYGATAVQNFFTAAAAAGITTVAQLAAATQEELLAIAANANALGNGGAATYTPVAITPVKAPVARGGSSGGGGGSRRDSKADEAKRDREGRLKDIQSLFESSLRYEAILKQLDEGTLSNVLGTDQLSKVYGDSKKAVDTLTAAEKKFNTELSKNGKVTAGTALELERAKKAVEDLTKAQEDLSKTISINEGLLTFATQFKNNIDLVQVAALAAGQTFKDMEKSALDAFLAGSTTFQQARDALNDSGQGIAGKTGAAGEAFSNLKKFGRKGGRLSLDALKDIAAEAMEVDAVGFDGLTELLIGQGADKESVQKFFVELANEGISSLDGLVKVSDSTGVKILAGLDDIKFPFEETNSEISALLQQISQIPTSKQIDITLNVDAKYGAGTKGVLERAGVDFSNYGKDSPGVKRRGA